MASHQTLRVLDGSYVLDRPADVTEVIPRADVLAVVFGPDGSTVMRRDDTGEDAWSALWNGDEAHDVQATGMLSAIVAPLAAGGVPVWVVSSYDGDLVLVPADRLDEASEVLQAAGRRSPAVTGMPGSGWRTARSSMARAACSSNGAAAVRFVVSGWIGWP